MIELAIAIGGALIGALIALGVHKKEHEMIRNELAEAKEERGKMDGRIDDLNVYFSKTDVALQYLIQAVDRNYEALENHKKAEG